MDCWPFTGSPENNGPDKKGQHQSMGDTNNSSTAGASPPEENTPILPAATPFAERDPEKEDFFVFLFLSVVYFQAPKGVLL